MDDNIVIKGIETNNLKNIDITLIKKKINLIIGPSGSGKSSLAYDTIAEIGNYEFMTMFADELSEPSYKVKSFHNMLAAVPLKQNNHNNNMRSTIGTYFGLNRSIGLMYAVALDIDEDLFVLNKEQNLCESCHGIGFIKKPDYNKIINFNVPLKNVPFKCWNRYKDFFSQIIIKFCEDNSININKTFRDLSDHEKKLLLYGISKKKYSIRYKKNSAFSRRTTYYYGVLTEKPMLTNYNLGKSFYSEVECTECNGRKYSKQLDNFLLEGLSIGDFMITEFSKLKLLLEKMKSLRNDIGVSFNFNKLKLFVDKAVELNLGHLYFHRAIPTLSGGELQRLRLVQVFITQLSDLLIVLDEPLSGLSGEEKNSIFKNITSLVDKHSIVIVDHGSVFYDVANNIITLGPKGGKCGGELIDFKSFIKDQHSASVFLAPTVIKECNINLNSKIYKYKGVNLCIGLDSMNLIQGRSGVGKSTLLREYLPQYFESYIYINQKPLLGNKNSTVATVLDISNRISKLYAVKYKKDKKFFSNLTGNDGMCPKCFGAGYIEYGNEYHHIMKVECKECCGTGFNKNLKKYLLNGLSIFDVWQLTLDEAIIFFKDIDPTIFNTCKIASNILLGHLRIGQLTGSLSGGENIRIKIMKARNTLARIIGIDEPFKGLSKTEINAVAIYLNELRMKGKTILVIDHTEDVDVYFSRTIELINENDILTSRVL
ncbi:MAG: ATP-binding cassette domain-containing protein [Veillonella sp.]|uniref:ATP-binding cassette domain-containing protein n=1 Tax=Veillonella sp. TaxID=1926307 RepID=UPI0029107896|nr:ATP-binding cassette domain-containing protein [Veillonella sp.]MDU4397517.1 ATP-binding cassette domain-containing protein [Veillonella sp.]